MPAVLKIAGMQVLAKVLYEIIVLPFTTWFVRYVKKVEGIDTYDRGINYNPFKISDIE